MNNNRFNKAKTTNAIFLAIVLITGTIALSSLFMMTANAQAQPSYYNDGGIYDNNKYYKKSFGNDNYYYEPQYPSYGKDNRDKSKDSSKSVQINKIKCNNINLNINNGQDTNNGNTTNNNNNETNNGLKKFNKDGFAFVCINNNNNIVVGQPQPTCETCFTNILTEQELNALIAQTAVEGGPESLQESCIFIEQNFQNATQRTFISNGLFAVGSEVGITSDKLNAILDCLEEVYGVDFPRPD